MKRNYCRLCGQEPLQIVADSPAFHLEKCPNCGMLQKNNRLLVNLQKERERYQFHNNSLKDSGYLQHLSPMVELLKRYQPVTSLRGLDFGSGPSGKDGLQQLLQQAGYENIELYDLHFFADKPIGQFDFITANEVIEHFTEPQASFALIDSLLKPGGWFLFRTEMLTESIDLNQWWYLRDQTHIAFYTPATILWIGKQLGWKLVFQSATHGVMQKA